MKRLALFSMLLSLSLFTLGCAPADEKTETETTVTTEEKHEHAEGEEHEHTEGEMHDEEAPANPAE